MMDRRFFQPAFVLTFLLLVVGAIGLSTAIQAFKLHLRKLPIEADRPVRAIPTKTTNWKQIGKDAEMAEDVQKTLGTENYVTRSYIETQPKDPAHPKAITLHLAYYTGMVDTVPHIPDRCMVGAGFQIATGTKVVPVKLDPSTWRKAAGVPASFPDADEVTADRLRGYSDGSGKEVILPFDLTLGTSTKPARTELPLRVTDFVGEDGRKIYIGYFFIANGRVTSTAEQVRLLAFNLTDDYAYYLKVEVSSNQVQSAEELAEGAASLLNDLLGEIMWCTPDWVQLYAKRIGTRN